MKQSQSSSDAGRVQLIPWGHTGLQSCKSLRECGVFAPPLPPPLSQTFWIYEKMNMTDGDYLLHVWAAKFRESPDLILWSSAVQMSKMF